MKARTFQAANANECMGKQSSQARIIVPLSSLQEDGMQPQKVLTADLLSPFWPSPVC